MNVGFGPRSLLTELGKKDKVKSSDLAEFFTNAVLFIVTIIKKLLEKSPAASIVVTNTSYLTLMFWPQKNQSCCTGK